MTTPTTSIDVDEEEISLLDLLIVLAKHKKLILGLPLLAAILALGVSLLLPNIYTATTKIMPPQQGQSSALAALGQLGALAGGAGGALGIKNPNDTYVAMIKSRRVADNLIDRFKLKERYETKTRAATYTVLDGVTNISAGKDGIITIEVDDKVPKQAAELANAYVDELYKVTQVLAVTEASKRRLFFEKQLDNSRNELSNAEDALRQTQETSGVLDVGAQSKALIEAIGNIRAQVAAKEVQLGAMRTFATEQNSDYVRAQQELTGMRVQLSKLEKVGEPGLMPTGKMPEAGLGILRKIRDVKYYETLFELLGKQYQMARIDEARDASIIQVLDKAVPPELKSRPKRSLIVILATLAAGFLGVILAFLKEANEKAKQDPEQVVRLDRFRKHMAWR